MTLENDELAVSTAGRDDLQAVLDLYRFLNPDDPILSPDEARESWEALGADPRTRVLVGRLGSRIVCTCVLAVIPNLTRGARPYALIENVVTHPDFRRRGLGTELLRQALQLAWDAGCYKAMLLTSRNEEATLRFYEQAGFRRGVKTGFVARSPETT